MGWKMLKKRVIPALLLKQGRMVKGVRFSNYRDTGDPKMAVRVYNSQDADELIFLNIDKQFKNKWSIFLNFLNLASEECFMPLTAGGGVNSVECVRDLLIAGADKVIITSASVYNSDIISSSAKIFGSQSIVAGIDYKKVENSYYVTAELGQNITNLNPLLYAKKLESLGAGEIFLNSVDRDGTMQGLDIELANEISLSVNIPVIIGGGAGNFMHLVDAFNKTSISGVVCASLFHFGDNNPIRARSYLKNKGIPMRILK